VELCNEAIVPQGAIPARPVALARGPGGFTLIELSVVLFVIAIVSAIAVPYFRDVTGVRVAATAKRLASTSRFLFEEAAFQGTTYALNFDLERQRWFVTRFDPTSGRFVADESLLARAVTLPEDVRFADVASPSLGKLSAGLVPSYFYPEGFADPAVIHLVDARSHAYTIRIDPIRGAGEIFDGYRDFESLPKD
jgi:prepilin-type N-terminal cleavage/methylation domain-containing protein